MRRLVELFRHRADERPDFEVYTFADAALLSTLDTCADRAHSGITLGVLDRRVRAVAARLQAVGEPGDRVVILEPPGLDFVVAWLGCVYAGRVAVPMYPPDPARFARTLPRFQGMATDAAPSVMLTTAGFAMMKALLLPVAGGLGDVEMVVTAQVPIDLADRWAPTFPDGPTPAMLQYTSGSTGTPKGVVLTHGSILANLEAMRRAMDLDRDSRQVCWLPPYHDLGLIAGILEPLYTGYTTLLMSPLDYLQRPDRWLRAIHWFRASVTGAPNFAYELTAKKFTPAPDDALDLSTWRKGLNGAEPVRGDTLRRFAEVFGPYGFGDDVIRPCYGLAENTLMVSGGGSRPAVVRYVERDALEKDRVVRERAFGGENAREVVGCGPVGHSVDVRIVDPQTFTECAFDGVGEIWVAGPSMAAGYRNRPEATAATFGNHLATGEGPFLRTGDLGFQMRGELFICGRVKDLIIIRGRNHYPEDIEATVADLNPAFRPGSTAAFQVGDPGDERLVVLQEIHARHQRDFDADAAFATVVEQVADRHGVRIDELVFLEARALYKTSSGKISRSSNRTAWAADELLVVARAADSAEAGAATAPRLGTETALAAIWSETVGAPVTDRTLAFTALGGDSIGIVELAGRIETQWGLRLDPTALLERPRLSDMAAWIDAGGTATTLDLDRDVWLDVSADDIAALPAWEPAYRELFVTGATGFVGMHLLRALLDHDPSIRVHALARADGPDAALARILGVLEEHRIRKPGDEHRIVPIAGDLAHPRFGLSRDAFDALGAAVDNVWHCGARVDWQQPYTALRGPNVDGTRTVIDLCVAGGRVSKLHFVSSLWVINPKGEPVIDERHRARWNGLKNGYGESKWVAENLCHLAAERGLPLTAYRSEFILPPIDTGLGPRTDFITRVYREVARTGLVASEAADVPMVAVDWLGEAMVAIAAHPASGGVYHMLWPEERTLVDVAEDFRALGYTIEQVPFDDWRTAVRADRDSALYPLREFLMYYSSLALSHMTPVVDQHTRSWLEAVAPGLIARHPGQRDLLAATLRGLHAEGLIDAAPGGAR